MQHSLHRIGYFHMGKLISQILPHIFFLQTISSSPIISECKKGDDHSVTQTRIFNAMYLPYMTFK